MKKEKFFLRTPYRKTVVSRSFQFINRVIMVLWVQAEGPTGLVGQWPTGRRYTGRGRVADSGRQVGHQPYEQHYLAGGGFENSILTFFRTFKK